ncbi:MAG: 3-dehydroquinate synthase [Treponema sp.]|jgi:3-dehydroquinate synthase|nr:3-dehydroquinate synthase [Treponema sp.]
MLFKFDTYSTKVHLTNDLPAINIPNALFVCDENTKYIAEKINNSKAPYCVLKSGEENKNWDSVEKIIKSAKEAGLGRDGVLVGVGGGVIGDLTGFAASIYMRGCKLRLVATTLLAMVDASVGGKTGFDLYNIKNFAGSFYPAEDVYIPLNVLETLPEKEFKSGLAELIKTLILCGSKLNIDTASVKQADVLSRKIELAVRFKGKIVSKDFKETKNKRALLNLGHTFGHALEAAAGLGSITHGEAVIWGIVQSCYLGLTLNITPLQRAKEITGLIKSLGYDCSAPHPLAVTETFKNALFCDKKKKQGELTFIVPNKNSAQIVELKDTKILDTILKDGFTL